MFYISVFGIILSGYLLNLCNYPKIRFDPYKIVIFILWFVLAFRYGQGSDYFSYKRMYEYCEIWENAFYNPYHMHGETGYRVLCYCIKGSYEIFVIILSSFEMWMLGRGIKRFSQNKWLALCIFFPTGYMSCYFSSFRQGIVVAIFIGYLLECMEDRKLGRYYIIVLLMITIHKSALILLLPPIIISFSYSNILIMMLLLSSMGIIFCIPFVRIWISLIPYIGSSASYYFEGGFSIFAMLERIVCLIFVLMLVHHGNKKVKKEVMDMIKLYCFGVGIYFLFASSFLVASRMMLYFKILEIFILPNLLTFPNKWRQLVQIVYVPLIVVMLLKNINSYLDQGMYYSNISIFEYPYISIYNKEKLLEYRRLPYWIDVRKEIKSAK